ncbi:3-methyladenine DNA glycosylase AlkC [Brevibacterium sp. Mu109]|uniref:DNA alkylation repair protein n=1 Tax=Brevibacterium sp. Mu109 TaxID=1255669 RepID=UPI000C3F6114|nr:DNA alkylation repair protein [Brevibacterium sp. Mu109]SMY00871.1 3-methyladenine DNA glycosylase AlkC [Brevibacterium sp. Mu109]
MPTADELISSQTAEALAHALRTVVPDLPLTRLHAAAAQLEGLPLRARVEQLESALLADVPGDYAALARVVRSAHGTNPTFTGWMIWPVTEVIASKAVADGGTEAFDDAMALLAELTGLLTAEFAIRSLITHDPDRALAIIRTWTASSDVHVRRLASEGTRPHLPWAKRIPELSQTPGATVPLLEDLYRDPAEYVRRSVANHLNDLSRDHAALVIGTAERWLAEPDGSTERVVRHGLRTLIKRGDPDALALLGFPSVGQALQIEGPAVDRQSVAVGEAVEFHAAIRNISEDDVRLTIDYVVHHLKANGRQSPKTFKLTTMTLRPGQMTELRRSHSFRPISTRRYYPGAHALSLQVNGVETTRAEFELTTNGVPCSV